MVTLCIILSILGVVMVLDASGPASLRDYGNYYSVFIRQCIFMIIGWVGFYIALRVPFSLLRKIAFPLYLLSIVLLILVAISRHRPGAQWCTLLVRLRASRLPTL
ncbi:MAG: FtsW/RodA/SpoVE family cell cycle protein [Lawsonella clevelandensis]